MLTEPPPDDAPAEARRVHRTVYRTAARWLEQAAIQGMGIGRQVTKGRPSRKLVIKVYVDRKKPIKEIRGRRIPRSIRVPEIAEPVPIDVEEIGTIKLHSATGRMRPAMPGCGISCANRTGTFGCLVARDGDEGVYVLSNAHVIGLDGTAAVGTPVVQPAIQDGGQSGDEIATFTAAAPISFAAGYPNLADAAVARVDDPDSVTSFVRFIGVPTGVTGTIAEGDVVQKAGYVSDYTRGVVKDTDYKAQFDYLNPSGGQGSAGFSELVMCTHFANDGDSGAAVLNMQGQVVGLHMAGTESISVFCRATHVFGALHLSLAR